nr:hypothetical protein [Candidatus Microthrix sp.]
MLVLERCHPHRTGRVDQQVEASGQSGPDPEDQLQVLGLAEVGGHPACLGQFFGQPGEHGGVAPEQDLTMVGECAHQGTADAPGGPGDQGRRPGGA